MNFFSKILSNKLHPAWEFATNGMLWRMLVSNEGHFVGEDRDGEQKTVSFFCLNGESGKILWRDVRLQEKWWVGIETIHNDVVFFHEYASPDMPGHKKIYAVEISTGKVLWFNGELEFLLAHEDCVYASKLEHERRLFFELDLHTGAVLRELDAQYITVLNDTVAPKSENVEFPQTYNFSVYENTQLRHQIEKAVSRSRDLQSIEYMEKDGKLVVSWYHNVGTTIEQPILNHEIAVVDESLKVIYRDLINANMAMAVPDSFFGKGNFVYYIKNKKTLVALKI